MSNSFVETAWSELEGACCRFSSSRGISELGDWTSFDAIILDEAIIEIAAKLIEMMEDGSATSAFAIKSPSGGGRAQREYRIGQG